MLFSFVSILLIIFQERDSISTGSQFSENHRDRHRSASTKLELDTSELFQEDISPIETENENCDRKLSLCDKTDKNKNVPDSQSKNESVTVQSQSVSCNSATKNPVTLSQSSPGSIRLAFARKNLQRLIEKSPLSKKLERKEDKSESSLSETAERQATESTTAERCAVAETTSLKTPNKSQPTPSRRKYQN